MKTLYLVGSICGIILAIIFCYQHRPYIERTAEIREMDYCITYGNDERLQSCNKSDLEEIYDFCGEEMTITSTVKKITCEGYYFLGDCYKTDIKLGKWIEKSVEQPTTYIPCYKSKLKFR